MPQYQCTQCGEAVDTGPSFAPAETVCPACRGEKIRSPSTPPSMAPPPPLPPQTAAFPGAATPYQSPYARPDAGQGGTLWPWVLSAHLMMVVAVVVLSINVYSKTTEPQGPIWLFAVGLCVFLIFEVAVAVPALVVAAILAAFRKSFRKSFAVTLSILLALLAVLMLMGALIPEEWVEESSTPSELPLEVE